MCERTTSTDLKLQGHKKSVQQFQAIRSRFLFHRQLTNIFHYALVSRKHQYFCIICKQNLALFTFNVQSFAKFADLFRFVPPCQIKGVSIFRARLSPRPRHRSVPSAYALHAAARTAPMRIEPVYSKQHAVKRAVAMFVSCCCLPLIDTMITPMFSVRTPLKQYETTRTRKTMFFTFCNVILNY